MQMLSTELVCSLLLSHPCARVKTVSLSTELMYSLKLYHPCARVNTMPPTMYYTGEHWPLLGLVRVRMRWPGTMEGSLSPPCRVLFSTAFMLSCSAASAAWPRPWGCWLSWAPLGPPLPPPPPLLPPPPPPPPNRPDYTMHTHTHIQTDINSMLMHTYF